jgi:glycosyltransferase involved in cell wall biosynthesis
MPFLPMRPFRVGLPFADPAFQKRIRETDIKLIHSHAPFVTGLMARRMARRRGIPHVTTFHSKYHEDFKRVVHSEALVRPMLKRLVAFYESADWVWAPNTSTTETLRSYGYHGRIDIVPSGTDMTAPTAEQFARYRAAGWDLLKARASRDFKLEGFAEAPIFMFVGQHRWEKNLNLIVRALAELQRRNVDFRAIFVGTGYAAEPLRREVNRRRLTSKVSFVGVVVDRERIKGLYALADLFLFPSLYDTVGLVVREAAAFGVPSVLVRGSSATEGIEDGREAFFTDNTPVAMADLLTELAADRERVRRVGEEARRRLDLSWRTIVERVYEKYREILESWSPP